jgi:hypothetical protein
MLIIRAEQLAVFSEAEVRKFEDWVLAHLKRFFPQQCAAESEKRLRRKIQEGATRAATYGITAKRDVCKFIDVMMVLGPDFEADPLFPKAKTILERKAHSSSKMTALTQYIETVLRCS